MSGFQVNLFLTYFLHFWCRSYYRFQSCPSQSWHWLVGAVAGTPGCWVGAGFPSWADTLWLGHHHSSEGKKHESSYQGCPILAKCGTSWGTIARHKMKVWQERHGCWQLSKNKVLFLAFLAQFHLTWQLSQHCLLMLYLTMLKNCLTSIN